MLDNPVLKQRFESYELRIMRSLNVRTKLSIKCAGYYSNLEKGFKGEQMFDVLSEGIRTGFYFINDLLLEHNNNEFQIDSLLISEKIIYPIDVKNFEGDYYIDNGKWYPKNGIEMKNPLHQLSRSETLLKGLLNAIGYSFQMSPHLCFINPNFYLYQAPLNHPLVFPTQLNRFINTLNKVDSKLNNHHLKFSETLISLHKPKSSTSKIPSYSYENLEKGIICCTCNSSFTVSQGNLLLCEKCGCAESVDDGILRSVKELILLFPDHKITTNGIYEWSGGNISKKRIRRILCQNFKLVGHSSSSHFINQ